MQPHIKIKYSDEICILSGNPDRVPIIASFFDDAVEIANHRGLIAYKATIQNKPVTILTTGMGSGSARIVIEEAYRAGARKFIRIGSCGAIQKDARIGDLFIAVSSVQDNSLVYNEDEFEEFYADEDMIKSMNQAASDLNYSCKIAKVWSTDIYYHPIKDYYIKWQKRGYDCVEMETATLLKICTEKEDMKAVAILTADGNINTHETIYSLGTEEYNQKVNQSIEIVVQAIKNGL